ncbi:hypothetical protein [Actinokineospora spheciospongiae]|nr:hypothetical protein [Actinokineospora spheciospongiae]
MVTEQLVAMFERDVRLGVDTLVEIGYDPTAFEWMIEEFGAVGATRRVVLDPTPSFGLWRLKDRGLLAHSVEISTLLPWYAPLFDEAVRDAAWRKLELLGVDVRAEVAKVGSPLVGEV